MTGTPYAAGSVPISNLPGLPGYAISAFDELAIVDLSATETKKITAQAFVEGVLNIMPPGSINGNLISFSTQPDIDPTTIPDGSITAAKLADNSSCVVSDTSPGDGAFTGQLWMKPDGTVYIWNGANWITAAADISILSEDLSDNSSGIWTDTSTFPGDDGDFIGQIAVSTDGQGYMWNGSSWFALTAIPPDGTITGAKMADNSTAVFYTSGVSNLTGEYTGQLAIDNAQGEAYAWTGSDWIALTSAEGSFTGTTGVINVEIDNQTNEISATLEEATGGGEFLAGPVSSSGAIGLRPIESSDLPVAVSSAPGAVSPGFTLAVDANGVLDIAESIISNPLEYHLVAYNEYGLVTDSAALADAVVIPPATVTTLGGIIVGSGLSVDLDGLLSVDLSETSILTPATESTLGGVIIGGGIAVSGDGVISIDNDIGAPGTFTKVTVNEFGLVTTGDVLLSTDIPDLDASKLTTGFIDPNRIAEKSIARRHLSDYSITFIQELTPSLNVGAIGGLWLKESTGVLSVFNGNRWITASGGAGSGGGTEPGPTGLRYGGIVDASTGLITILTTEGSEAGFLTSTELAGLVTEDNVGIYFVVNPAGDQITVIPDQATNTGDWVVAGSPESGWVWVDRSTTTEPLNLNLEDLGNVDADAPVDGDCVIYNATNSLYETRHINVNELGDVAINSPVNNQVLSYTNGVWVNAAAANGGAITSDAPSDGKQYARQNEGWTEIVIPEIPVDGHIPIVSETAPSSPTVGMIWIRPSNLRQYVYMTDAGGSSQWASVMCC